MSCRTSCLIRWVLLILCCGIFSLDQVRAKVSNPHGPLDIGCNLCHTEESWQVAERITEFDHSGTGFVLAGAHNRAVCRDCHRQLVFAHVGISCVDCHDDFHRSRLGADCEECHTPEGWVDRIRMQRDHDATAFPLVGGHFEVDCDACHDGPVSSQYVGTPRECVACHRPVYDRTLNPDHAAVGFGFACQTCHTVFANTWGSGDFRHSVRFPLTAGHGGLECSACHAQGFQATSFDCYACHRSDYDAAVDPEHAAAAFPIDCVICHSTTIWQGATYDHVATAFPLTGAHVPLDCLSCHSGGFVGTATDCYSCHQVDYDAANDPDHAGSFFPTDCMACHTTVTWVGAEYNHANTSFPLTGAHTPLDCVACHSAGYVGTPADCYSCHRGVYEATTSPGHASAGFPVDCKSCHSTSAWKPSTWNHDILFPIYSGKHRGTWNSCVDCHVVATDYSLFECITCHEHNQSSTDREHDEVRNYRYLSTACLDCHPRGDE